jgi:hypothetical protein
VIVEELKVNESELLIIILEIEIRISALTINYKPQSKYVPNT